MWWKQFDKHVCSTVLMQLGQYPSAERLVADSELTAFLYTLGFVSLCRLYNFMLTVEHTHCSLKSVLMPLVCEQQTHSSLGWCDDKNLQNAQRSCSYAVVAVG